MPPQPRAASDREDIGEGSRGEESAHQSLEQSRQEDVAQSDIITDRIATAVAPALRGSNKDHSIERATKLGAKVFTGMADPAEVES